MEEFTSVMVWLFIGFVVVGVVASWMSGVSENHGILIQSSHEMMSSMRQAQSDLEDEVATQEQNNWFVSAITAPLGLLSQLWTSLTYFFSIIFNVMTVWYSLLVSMFSGYGAVGELVIGIFTPIILVAEVVSVFTVLLKVFLIIRGFVQW